MEKLNSNSLVIDAGGYLGNTTAKLVKQFNSNVIIFEPIPQFAKYCRERFVTNHKILVVENALGKETKERKLYFKKDGTSCFKEWAKSDLFIEVPFIQLSNYIKDIPQIDLLILNIEGSEYDVIEDLAENGEIGKIKELSVQFHKIDGWEDRYKISQETLLKTHKKIRGNFIWETWSI